MAILGVEGFSALPRHCLQLCYGFFGFAVGANLMRDLSPPKYGRWVPLPMAMAVPFLVGANFAIDMCVGSLVVFVWHRLESKKATLMVPAVASGLICGDGLWILPSSILALAKILSGTLTFSPDSCDLIIDCPGGGGGVDFIVAESDEDHAQHRWEAYGRLNARRLPEQSRFQGRVFGGGVVAPSGGGRALILMVYEVLGGDIQVRGDCGRREELLQAALDDAREAVVVVVGRGGWVAE
ncbi:putative metal-nicotianamine transporter YSL9 [Acorus gramineus]|uniref:Metal-nicotianamine transporter YSL9 n=1 Tax=Acorus gramineus TaxID=55184 RepID=A0AAV9A1Z6_ACOGR|nr:putative metal-nicotianamine transporter YSL9 [Acorus gramineus]